MKRSIVVFLRINLKVTNTLTPLVSEKIQRLINFLIIFNTFSSISNLKSKVHQNDIFLYFP